MEVVLSFSFMLMGMFGLMVSRKNLMGMLMAMELILLAANFNAAVVGLLLDDSLSLVICMVILSLAGVEASLGLSMLIVYYRLRGLMSTSYMVALKG